MLGLEGGLDGGGGVGLGGGRGDACGGEPVVGRQGLEERYGFLEEVDGFFGGCVARVAAGLEGADAGAVLAFGLSATRLLLFQLLCYARGMNIS